MHIASCHSLGVCNTFQRRVQKGGSMETTGGGGPRLDRSQCRQLNAAAQRWIAQYRPTHAEASDIVQDAWTKCLARLPSLRAPHLVEPWFRRIVLRTLVDSWRKKIKSEKFWAEAGPLLEASSVVSSPGSRDPMQSWPESWLDTAQQQLEGEACLFRRRVVEMHYRDGMRIREIAGSLGVPEGTVLSHLHRFRKCVKQRIQLSIRADH